MNRRWIWVLGGLAALGGLWALARGPIALRVMRAGAERNFTADLVGELPDGLHVLLCGAGGPLPDPVRSGPCTAVIAGRRLFVVDAGSGGARNLLRMGVPPGRIELLLVTHMHSDHIDGIGELALQRWVGGTHASPLPVVGPSGIEEVVDGFDRAYRLDAGYRTAHHGPAVAPPGGAGVVARPFEPPREGETLAVWDEEGLRITAFRVDHQPVEPAVGYRFDYGGRSVLISGDTKKSASLARNAQGVDLLVHEALSPRLVALARDAAAAAGRANVAKIMQDIPDYHTTPVEAAEIARDAGAGHLLFNHVVPPLLLPGLDVVFLEGVSDAYAGDVTLGRDGTFVSLPVGSTAVEVGRR
jgi:ribonuclease Z